MAAEQNNMLNGAQQYLATAQARKAFETSERHTLPDQLHYESERQRELIEQPSFAEGVMAFLQKRAPVFPKR